MKIYHSVFLYSARIESSISNNCTKMGNKSAKLKRKIMKIEPVFPQEITSYIFDLALYNHPRFIKQLFLCNRKTNAAADKYIREYLNLSKCNWWPLNSEFAHFAGYLERLRHTQFEHTNYLMTILYFPHALIMMRSIDCQLIVTLKFRRSNEIFSWKIDNNGWMWPTNEDFGEIEESPEWANMKPESHPTLESRQSALEWILLIFSNVKLVVAM